MRLVNILEAKSTLSRLVESLEQGEVREIVIARNGRPAAKLVPIDTTPSTQRLGIAKGKFEVPFELKGGYLVGVPYQYISVTLFYG